MKWFTEIWLSSRKGTRRTITVIGGAIILYFLYKWNGDSNIFPWSR